jgi:hypothetical protein
MSWGNILKQNRNEILITDVRLEAGGGNPEDPNKWVDFDIDDAEVTAAVDLYVENGFGRSQIACKITKVMLTGDGIEPTEIKEWEVDKAFPELSYYKNPEGIVMVLEAVASISKHKDGTYHATLYF